MMRPMSKPLLDETLELARTANLPVVEMCREVGVTPRWFYMFVAGEIPDPSVRRVQRLHDYLMNAQRARAPQPDPIKGAA